MAPNIVYEAILNGFRAVLDYISAHVLTCLIPAFFIAGAISAFVKKDAILKYFGPEEKKHIAYPLASISGTVLAVCSCTILPIFAGIYKKGSGIGPAITFLFAGPAINLLAIIYTAQILGYEIGIARAVASILMSILIGIVMSVLFREHDRQILAKNRRKIMAEEKDKPLKVQIAFFSLLLAILIVGGAGIPIYEKLLIMLVFVALLIFILKKNFTKRELRNWGTETWDLTKKIFPILVAGTFVLGLIAYFLPPSTFAPWLGGNSIISCFTATVVGALLYMPTLLEVPIVGTTLGYTHGVIGGGPALSLLLAGPSLSLPSMIVLQRIIGTKKAMAYIFLVIIMSTVAGYLYGLIGV
ncbi:MAG: permease [Thermoplasmata archaeon]